MNSEEFTQEDFKMMEEVNKYFLEPNVLPKRPEKIEKASENKLGATTKTNRKSKSTVLKSKDDQMEEQDNQVYDKEKIKFIQETLLYPGEDVYPKKLVHRPEKGVVWGLGGELLRRRKGFFEKGKLPEIEELVEFLEVFSILSHNILVQNTLLILS